MGMRADSTRAANHPKGSLGLRGMCDGRRQQLKQNVGSPPSSILMNFFFSVQGLQPVGLNPFGERMTLSQGSPKTI